VVVLFVGDYNEELAIHSVEFATLGLLAGMMILVYLTQQSGIYDYIAVKAGQLSRGNPFLLVIMMVAVVAILSGFLDNLTTILLVVPITFLLADTLDINPMPLILIEVMAANIGGTATLIGDPPNIMIGDAAGLTFNDFLVNNLPGALLRVPEADRRGGGEPQVRDGARRRGLDP
jgi:Na+/H+ antiporter NhaD/arsenite permease-like protein